jgi:hypothetical protein
MALIYRGWKLRRVEVLPLFPGPKVTPWYCSLQEKVPEVVEVKTGQKPDLGTLNWS